MRDVSALHLAKLMLEGCVHLAEVANQLGAHVIESRHEEPLLLSTRLISHVQFRLCRAGQLLDVPNVKRGWAKNWQGGARIDPKRGCFILDFIELHVGGFNLLFA